MVDDLPAWVVIGPTVIMMPSGEVYLDLSDPTGLVHAAWWIMRWCSSDAIDLDVDELDAVFAAAAGVEPDVDGRVAATIASRIRDLVMRAHTILDDKEAP